MVPGLYPVDLIERAFNSLSFHWQNDFETNSTQRQLIRGIFSFRVDIQVPKKKIY